MTRGRDSFGSACSALLLLCLVACGSNSPGGAADTGAGSSSGGAAAASSAAGGPGSAGSGAGVSNAGGPAGGAPGAGSSTGGNAGSEAGGSGGNGGGSVADPNKRKLLLKDEGNAAVHYVDLEDPANNWHQTVPAGRDLQLIGNQQFMIGTDNGWQERQLSDGTVAKDVTTFPGTLAAHRLHNGNTLLSGVDFQGGQGIVLAEITPQGTVARTIEYPGDYVRLVRETKADHFLLTANTRVFEGDAQGNVTWEATITGSDMPHAWEALRLASGDVVVGAGYAAGLQFFGADEKLKNTITGGEGVMPFYFADIQILPGGNIVVANWQGHGAGNGGKGLQLVEYDPAGKLVWSWQQDMTFVSSLQGVLVLDGLDLDKLQVENPETGVLEAAN